MNYNRTDYMINSFILTNKYHLNVIVELIYQFKLIFLLFLHTAKINELTMGEINGF